MGTAGSGRPRLLIVDALRGLVIVDMMAVHYDYLLPEGWLRKVVGYSDIAMEGFLALSGFMVGFLCLERFRSDPAAGSRALLARAATVYAAHAVLVLTLSLPLALRFGAVVTGGDPPWRYALELLLLLRQEGLMHILPTFIPLFIVAVPVLALVARGRVWPVLAGSAIAFALGMWDPHPLGLGDPPIFPVLLWQVYFVLGLLVGARVRSQGRLPFGGVAGHAAVAAGLFLLAAWAYHGHHIAPAWAAVRERWHLQVRRFPLGVLGFVHGASLLSLVVCVALACRAWIERSRLIEHTLGIMGRHSLATFAIHVCFAQAAVASRLAALSGDVALGIALANVPATLVLLHLAEARGRAHRREAPPR